MMQNTGRYWIYRTLGFADSPYQSPLTMRTFLFALLLLPLTGCDSNPVATANAQSAELLTDKRTYYQSNGPYINVSLANVSDQLLYIASPSFDTVLDMREEGEWLEIGAWYVIGAIGPFPTRLEPGTYRTWPALTVSEPVFLLEPGQYRIRTKVYEDEQLERLLPEEDLVSEPFEIVPE